MSERKPCFCAPDPIGQCDNCAAWEAEQDFIALNEAHADYGCGFIDCVNNPGCDPGDPNCPAMRAASETKANAHLSAAAPETWPTTGEEFGNPWHRNATAFVALIDQHRGFWGRDFDLKYLNLRIDTRNNQFVLLDRDNQRIHADRVLNAIRQHVERFGRPSSKMKQGASPQ